MNDTKDAYINLNPNPLVKHLGKLPKDFTKEDITKFVTDKEVKIIDLCHVAEDGRLKTLSFAVNNEARVVEILDSGERVDGSSLFSFVEPAKSDTYIKPKFDKAFLNPFNNVPTLSILCSYLDEKGRPLDISPENILRTAQDRLLKNTGVELQVLCELEFYIIAKLESEILYEGTPQKNYQESSPFVKYEPIRNEILTTLATAGIPVKYGHTEVGVLQENDQLMEQHEVELRLQSPLDMADDVSIAKWIIRNVAAKHGAEISFAPKLSQGHAGNGMHVHVCGRRQGESVMTDEEGELSAEAKSLIGGMLKLAPSLTAFGNTVPTSYLRLVPQQEAPTNVYWGYKNREALIRVPLATYFEEKNETKCLQTFELRLPDGSADVYLLLAGMLTAAYYGLMNKEKALRLTDETLMEGTKFKKENVKTLPTSCYGSAKLLEKNREDYEKGNVFPKRVIDGVVQRLRRYDDQNLIEILRDDPEKTKQIIKKYLHCG